MAEAVARATDLQAAFEAVITEVSRVLRTSASIFQKCDRGWTLEAGAQDHGNVPDLQAALNRLTGESIVLIKPEGMDNDGWTAMSLTGPSGPPVALLLAGDWTVSTDVLSTWALLASYALSAVRERDVRQDAERLLVNGYTMARRLSRLGSVEDVAQRVVDHVARMVNAERVAVAMYRPAEDCLVVVASHGYPLSTVKDVRIQPGAWVIGHVYSSGRPVFVRDVRHVQGMARDRQSYRTFSFAAVPLFAGSETVGVLTATDKRERPTFNRQDIVVMRAVSVAAALALVAARSHTEVSRLAYAATIDSLTGLLNRPYLDARLHQEVERARRGANALTVLMADIDDFKRINDTYGHQIGDAVLQVVGGIIRSAVRVFDVCARYGGDEFAILMPSSDHSSAAACAERIRRRVAEYRGEHHGGPKLPALTMSIGVAVIQTGDSAADLILRADRCLYQAKADGKNLVRVHPSIANLRPGGPGGQNEREPA